MKKWVRALLITIWLAPATQFFVRSFYYMMGFSDMHHPFFFAVDPEPWIFLWLVTLIIWMVVGGIFIAFVLYILEES